MQLLLHATGRRVDYRKHQGLFRRIVSADHYTGDLTQLGNADGRRISIKRSWMRVGERAAAGTGWANSRGGVAPEKAESGLPVVVSGRS